ncbi:MULTISPECIES: hypothetical protein [Legionella]|uniref:Transmembrane protein n=1 Tax=Legionella drozanskii LLAP-1 TaxID=1212489 RepID=A0A0W0TDL4_9GAMM|nr:MULTISPECIES: hypothetical protein [Legionella]KTC93671.1 transmembrane protein [Legionella drozanskii LLAP-1]PJE12699.1 MAG: hypothetical protein CK430_07135 [Legionella sp.]
MEQDRFQQNSKLFILGLVCLLACLSLFGFGFYILPYLLWNWNYDVPEFVLSMREWYKESYNFSDSGSAWMVFLTFIVPAIITGLISQYSSNHIDNEIYHLNENKEERRTELKRDVQETLGFGLKIFFLIILVLVAVTLVEWLVAPPTI